MENKKVKRQYDYLIVGAGPFGATTAHELNKAGKKCLVIDKRNHIAGNIYTEKMDGINVHKYGAHIFHTNNESIWNYLNQFCDFNNYINSPLANFKGELYNLPFNMNTFYQIWGVIKPIDAINIIENEKRKFNHITKPKNLEEQALVSVGEEIYNKLIKGYTEKQWGRSCKDLPSSIIKRIPLRFKYDNNYFNDRYQGIPVGGYTEIINKMLNNIEVRLNTDYYQNREYFDNISDKIIFSGTIDQFFNYEYGPLEYRSLKFETNTLEIENYQGNAVVNYTDSETPYTRILEHKHFEFGNQRNTVITKEYSQEWNKDIEPYYPINNQINSKKFDAYKEKSKEFSKVIFGGRLGTYRYYDMHQVFASALKLVQKELEYESN